MLCDDCTFALDSTLVLNEDATTCAAAADTAGELRLVNTEPYSYGGYDGYRGYLYWRGEAASADQYWGAGLWIPGSGLYWQTYTDGDYYYYGSIYQY